MLLIVGSIIMPIGDKGCQSLFRQGDKNCKINVIDHSIEKCFGKPNEFLFQTV